MIQEDSRVVMHVTLRTEGNLIHTTAESDPLDYVLGSGGLFPGLEAALIGMKAGERKTATVPPEEAFGVRNPEAIKRVPKTAFDNVESLNVGDAVRGQVQDRPFTAYIQAVDEQEVTLDLNHPLAGKTIDFEVEVLQVL